VSESPREPVHAAARLAELKPMLSLFAQALGGHAVTLYEGAPAHGAAPVRPSGPASPIDIALPAQVACFSSDRDNRAAYRIAVMRQVLGWHGDPALHDAVRDASVLWRRVFVSLERLRIDSAIARTYPGARADLMRQRAHELAQRRASPPRRWPLTRALDTLARHALGNSSEMRSAADESAPLHTALQHADSLNHRDATAFDSARVASFVCSLLGVHGLAKRGTTASLADAAMAAPLASNGNEPADPRDADVSSPAGVDAATFAPAATRSGADAAATGTRYAGRSAELMTAVARPSLRKHGPPTTTRRDPAATRARIAHDDEPNGLVHAIDEWDYQQQRLLPDWCTLIERRLPGADSTFIGATRRRHPGLARRVHRQFAAWRPEGLQRVHGASDGDELELDRVIEAMVDRRAGLLDDRAGYVRRDRAQRDVATAFLVDTSASTDFVLPDGTVGPPRPPPSALADAVYLYDLAVSAPPAQAPKRRVIDVAKEALALMCDALHALGDCFAVYTFSGHGRAHVDFRIVKSFHEAVSSRTAAALAALRPHGATRTGAAIRHAAMRLARQPQRRRALIVVTDGYPEDIDYGPEPRDPRYGIEDTAHALQEAQALGVHTFCLSIDPAGHDYLRRMCPPQRYMAIGDLAALPGELAKVYQAMTRSSHGA
jgi:hypothetical protein